LAVRAAEAQQEITQGSLTDLLLPGRQQALAG
jgi:hypothetical protein